ncbi:hypothetical protein U9M48_021165 [Paspalum notatum var. saurae]|uniref:Uncharacterized protein n=1 Tax=Paspalum notatum var. saurae TaxID=547442 RepID=A0AAQ3TH15_PASNO
MASPAVPHRRGQERQQEQREEEHGQPDLGPTGVRIVVAVGVGVRRGTCTINSGHGRRGIRGGRRFDTRPSIRGPSMLRRATER